LKSGSGSEINFKAGSKTFVLDPQHWKNVKVQLKEKIKKIPFFKKKCFCFSEPAGYGAAGEEGAGEQPRLPTGR
jgi:hypothetical protein